NPELADNQVVTNKLNSDSKTNKNPELADNQVVTNKVNIDSISPSGGWGASTQLENTLAKSPIKDSDTFKFQSRFRSPLWLSFTASPLYTFRHILPNNTDSLVITQFAPKNSFARQTTGFALSLALEKPINQRLTAWAGFYGLSTRTADVITYYDPEQVTYNYLRIDSARMVVQPNLNAISTQQSHSYRHLTLNLGLKYHLGGQRIRQNLVLGSGYSRLISYQTTPNDLKTNSLNQQNIALIVSYELDYQLLTRWRLRIAPTAIHYLKPWFRSDALYQARPYQLSLQIGLSYRLR
ncbi:MAG: hypothetical protein MUE85_18020, partial [Microscillaceae bacterium]|nr:hypothetical protein [Microscillaceae bacterium]